MKYFANVLLALILVSVMTACTTTENLAQGKTEGIAPDFEMKDLEGNTVKLSDFEGENIYIKYWASWCPICLGGLEDVNILSGEELNFKVFTIVGADYKGEKSAEDFKEWFAGVENTENITVLLDEKGAYTAATGVGGYPTSEWIDKKGKVIKISPGHIENDVIKNVFVDIK